MADSLANYALNKDTWDINDIQVAIDGHAVDFFGNDTRATVSLSNDGVTWSINADGEGIKIRSHNDSGDITVNVSQMSNMWQYILANKEDFQNENHSISIHTTAEITTTNTGVLGRLPNPSATNNPASLGLTFHCKKIDVQGVK